MIKNFDHNHIKNDSILFFDHLKKIYQITHFHHKKICAHDLIENLFIPYTVKVYKHFTGTLLKNLTTGIKCTDNVSVMV